MVKLGATGVVTVRLTLVDSTVLFVSEPVPVTVTEVVPVAAVELALKVRTELPAAPIGLVPKANVTPEGKPEADSVIEEL
jgi:hypothetical protein